jgi:hypothetical protein
LSDRPLGTAEIHVDENGFRMLAAFAGDRICVLWKLAGVHFIEISAATWPKGKLDTLLLQIIEASSRQ